MKTLNAAIDGKNFFDQPVRRQLINLVIFKKLQQIKVVCFNIIVLKTIIRWQVNNNHLMPIQNQCNKSILLEI